MIDDEYLVILQTMQRIGGGTIAQIWALWTAIENSLAITGSFTAFPTQQPYRDQSKAEKIADESVVTVDGGDGIVPRDGLAVVCDIILELVWTHHRYLLWLLVYVVCITKYIKRHPMQAVHIVN